MTTDISITPFTLEVPETQLAVLRARLRETIWPEPSDGADWSSGMPVAYGKRLARRWVEGFDWRAQEHRLNAIPQFTTVIDGHAVHFFHRPSPREDATPLLLLHGWPGSSTEFAGVMDELAEPPDPTSPAFHVIAPTIPGFGVSGPTTGWGPQRAAEAFCDLVRRLGYTEVVVHGYDLGAIIARRMGLLEGTPVALLHLTALFGSQGPTPETIDHDDPEESAALAASMRYAYELSGYALVQSARPQSVAYFGADSSASLLAWIIERFRDWSAADENPEEAIDVDEMLTTVSIYALFGTLGSSARYYQEGGEEWVAEQPASSVPTAVCRMPDDISTMVRRFAERNNRIVRWTTLESGGHFGLWEEPEMVVADLRRAVAAHHHPGRRTARVR
ncbi:epoxide hydrolase family protein [Dietzia timorensis]|uniref:Putative epoxide hydrolase n=1 Tax=Dietzia timorensis TaxID=499555 RepID=A0A173LJJ2_9ACTN|nr:epoxide hydrolase family protein [Dietzia timorensis]ANI90892.1 Putative epoxide hydrolase [Dietzia timorensis]